MGAARSLINAYRELHPQLLHRSLRGREATMSLTKGEGQTPEFGRQVVHEMVDGLEMLTASKRKKRKADGEDADGEQDAAAEAAALMTDKVLSADDFKKLRKLRLQKSIEMQLGRKRKVEEVSSSSESGSGSNSDSDAVESDGERGMPGRMHEPMSAAGIKARATRAKTKAGRMASIEAGRTDYKAKILETRMNRRGGKTNTEHKRNKPLMMTLKSRDVRKKASRTGKQRVQTLKKHIKTLKGTSNHPKKRRV